MTEAIFRRQNGELSLHIKGHAGYSEHGEPDIVCAAVSCLAQSLALAVENVGNEAMPYDAVISAGDVKISAAESEKTRALFMMAEVGLMSLSETYPECVKLKK
jgi:uncharacterized protein YsxB (DUF464 family)